MYTSVGSYARENAETGSAEIDHSADVPSANLLRVVLVSYIERVKQLKILVDSVHAFSRA
jgi:hypothetical protein